MPFRNEGYDPETVILLQHCLDVACAAASKISGMPREDDLRNRLAVAVMEGADTGIRDREALVDFALCALPAFRSRLAN